MIEIDIPKDIRQYDSKLIGPFTTRQTICLGIGIAIVLIVYPATKKLGLASDVQLFVSASFAIPALLFGWLKPYGMTLEKFLAAALVSNFIAPKRRLYKTQNIYIDRKILSEAELKKLRKERAKRPKSPICTPYK